MYQRYFNLDSAPFSIAPDPEFLFMSQGHKEALAHLSYVLHQNGGFVLLTGEVGTGKTTVCRAFLKTLPDHVALAYIINPKISGLELLEAIARELKIEPPKQEGSRLAWQRVIYEKLLQLHGQGKQTLLMIDEAQNLAPDVLEEVRLLTNLETDKHKLLTIILMGQPELREMLSHYELRQLNQRITARFHLNPLSAAQVKEYLGHRLKIAGLKRPVFSTLAQRKLHQLSAGVPRLINVLADRAMLAAYVGEKKIVNSSLVTKASKEVLPLKQKEKKTWSVILWSLLILSAFFLFVNKSAVVNEIQSMVGGSAKKHLAAYWQVDSPDKLCLQERLRCFQATLVGRELNAMGHPLVRYNTENKSVWVPISELSQLPLGAPIKALIVWRSPEGYEKAIKPGGQSKSVIWLRDQFDDSKRDQSLNGWEVIRPANYNPELFDAELVAKLRAFQKQNGLKPDGVLGPKTVMMINNVNGLMPPVIQAE